MTRTTAVALATLYLTGCMWASPLKLRTEYTASADSQPATPRQVRQVRVLDEVPTDARVLGTYFIEADHGFFHNYRSEWRNPYCGAQRPLVFLTLFLFEIFPTYWPCYKHSHDPIEELQAAAMRVARKHGGDAIHIHYEDLEDDEAKSVRGTVLALSPDSEPSPSLEGERRIEAQATHPIGVSDQIRQALEPAPEGVVEGRVEQHREEARGGGIDGGGFGT